MEEKQVNKIHTVYKLADGTRVPSVTTILGILAKPALIHWAWKLGCEGLDYQKVRDEAGDIGTITHAMIVAHLRGEEISFADYTPRSVLLARGLYSRYLDWEKGHKLEPILMETPLIAEQARFGGTPDFYGLVDGKKTLLDFKTSGEIYAEYYHQLAAYKFLLEGKGHEIEDVFVLRFGKKEEDTVDERHVGDLATHLKIFQACRVLYELQKQVRRE